MSDTADGAARRVGAWQPLVIGVVGGSGSGKTTVARSIYDALGLDAAFLDQDAYYLDLAHLSLAERMAVNFDHPDAFDTELLLTHVAALRDGLAVDKPTYDFAAHTRAAATVRPMHLEFVEPSKRYADVILPVGGHNQVGIDMILARVFMELSRRRSPG